MTSGGRPVLDPSRRARVVRLAAGSALLLAAAVTIAVLVAAQPRVDASPGRVRIDSGSIRYVYSVLTGTEGLYDLRSDPACMRNLIEQRRDVAARLRATLERKLGVRDLRSLREQQRDLIDRLRSMGYL